MTSAVLRSALVRILHDICGEDPSVRVSVVERGDGPHARYVVGIPLQFHRELGAYLSKHSNVHIAAGAAGLLTITHAEAVTIIRLAHESVEGQRS
jgi:hypothetical protein